jgi:hypothetical protein
MLFFCFMDDIGLLKDLLRRFFIRYVCSLAVPYVEVSLRISASFGIYLFNGPQNLVYLYMFG